MDSVLAVLTHTVTLESVAIRRNIIAVVPTLLQRCGGSSLRASLEQLVPLMAERMVDTDPGVRDLSRAALIELLSVVRASAAVPALLAKSVLGRGTRTREAVLLLLVDALDPRQPTVAGSELATAFSKHLPTLMRLIEEVPSPSSQAVLDLLQQLYCSSAATELRQLLTSRSTGPGVPRHALRVALGRLDEVDRGVAPAISPPVAPLSLVCREPTQTWSETCTDSRADCDFTLACVQPCLAAALGGCCRAFSLAPRLQALHMHTYRSPLGPT